MAFMAIGNCSNLKVLGMLLLHNFCDAIKHHYPSVLGINQVNEKQTTINAFSEDARSNSRIDNESIDEFPNNDYDNEFNLLFKVITFVLKRAGRGRERRKI
jgi:hypothetical protein